MPADPEDGSNTPVIDPSPLASPRTDASTDTFHPAPGEAPGSTGTVSMAMPQEVEPLPFDRSAALDFLSRFEIGSVLGRGGMGVVHHGVQLALARRVALKFVTGVSAQARRRFERERHVLARMNHPNVVQVHDAGEVGGVPYVVMELVDGVTLKEHLLYRGGRLAVPDALSLLGQLMDGLEYIHSQGAIHRDLKPANVFRTRDGRIKIADFGLAWAADDLEVSHTGQVMGTPAFMPPEQFQGPVETPAADLYALGAMLFQMLTGRLPLEFGSFAEYHAAHVRRTPLRSLRSLDPSLPAFLEEVCAGLLRRDPATRVRTVAQLRSWLDRRAPGDDQQHVAGLPADAEQGAMPDSEPPMVGPGPLPAIAFLLLIAGLALGGWLYRDRVRRVPAWPDPVERTSGPLPG